MLRRISRGWVNKVCLSIPGCQREIAIPLFPKVTLGIPTVYWAG